MCCVILSSPTTKAPPDLIKVNAVKMDWIKRKIFRTLINLICHCGKTGFQEGMVQPVEVPFIVISQ